jgi:DNA-binding transcriptional LysR family regulator
MIMPDFPSLGKLIELILIMSFSHEMSRAILDLDLVHCFLHVAESGGFTAASKRLHLSQSAVSLKIQRLEAQLDRTVFDRGGRRLALSAEGEILLSYARQLMALNEETVRTVSRKVRGGHLNLGVAQQFGQEFLFRLMSRFRKAHPDITLGVEVGMSANLLRGLEEGRFDVVLAAERPFSNPAALAAGVVQESLLRKEPMHWVQARDSQIDPGEGPLPLVAFLPPCGHRQRMIELLERKGRGWRIAYSSASLPAIQAAIEADWGIGVLAPSLITPKMKIIGKETKLPPFPSSAIALYRRKSSDETLAGSLVQFLMREVRRPSK